MSHLLAAASSRRIASGSPCRSATDRGSTNSSSPSNGVFSSCSGLAFSGALVCASVCVCAGFVSVPSRPLLCLCGAGARVAALRVLVLALAQWGGLLRVGSPVRFWVLAPFFSEVFSVISRDAPSDNTGEFATRQKCASSSELSAHQMARAGVAAQLLGAKRTSRVATLVQTSMSSATLWLESASHQSPLSARSLTPYAVVRVSGFMVFSDSAKAAAPQLEPTLEAALRKYDVHENIITAFRCNFVKSQAVVIALDRTVEGLTGLSKKLLGWMPAKASPTNANLLNSSQHGRKARFSLRPKPKWMQSHGHTASPSIICLQIGRAS